MNHLLQLNDYELETLRRALDIALHITENAPDYPIILEPNNFHIRPRIYHDPDYQIKVPFTDENLQDLGAIIGKVKHL